MVEFTSAHQVTTALVSLYVFFAIVGALPAPVEGAGIGYRFIYSFTHTLAANLLKTRQVAALVATAEKAA